MGKTIEVGIVIHDLLGRKPDSSCSRSLPWSIEAQQWLCELYANSAGLCSAVCRNYARQLRERETIRQAIISFTGALDIQSEWLTAKWDLVVIDEAHHLLNTPQLYRLAKQLSQNSEGSSC